MNTVKSFINTDAVKQYVESVTTQHFTILQLSKLVSCLIGLFIAFIGYQTFLSPPPVVYVNGVDRSVNIGNLNVFDSSRTYIGNSEKNVIAHYSVYKKEDTSRRIVFNGGMIGNKGRFTIKTSAVLSHHVNGQWCSHITLHWWPPLSLWEHELSTDDICFEIKKLPNGIIEGDEGVK